MTCQSPTPIPPDEKAQRQARRARRSFRKSANRLVEHIGRKLSRRWNIAMFPPEDLAALRITLEAPLDIDTEDPLDLEPRFFLPGPPQTVWDAMKALEAIDPQRPLRPWSFGYSPQTWRELIGGFQPIEWRREWNHDGTRYFRRASKAAKDAEHVETWCHENTTYVGNWGGHSFTRKLPWSLEEWEGPNGRPICHRFDTCYPSLRYLPNSKKGCDDRDERVPHALISVADSICPRDGSILRSELVAATHLIGTQLRNLDKYADHDIFPVLVISIHGRFSARILQAHVDADKRFVIRASRLINLNTLVVNSEVELLLRWHNPRPIGETRQQASEDDSVLRPNTTLPIRCSVPGKALQQALTV